MQQFFNLLFQTRSLSSTSRDQLSARHNISIEDAPVAAFGMIYNVITSALEQTSHYHSAWGEPSSLSNETRDGREKLERLMLTSKTMFIWSMSAIEFVSKEAIEKFADVLQPGRPPLDLYFGEIIKASANRDLISDAKRPLWYGLNKIRNRLVHNNGIANEDVVIEFSNDLVFSMIKGQPTEGNMFTFPRLTFWLVREYTDWCDQFLSRR